MTSTSSGRLSLLRVFDQRHVTSMPFDTSQTELDCLSDSATVRVYIRVDVRRGSVVSPICANDQLHQIADDRRQISDKLGLKTKPQRTEQTNTNTQTQTTQTRMSNVEIFVNFALRDGWLLWQQ